MSSQKMDLVGQYLSLVLIPRLQYADKLYQAGKYEAALGAQESVIRALYRANEEEEKILVKWTKQFSKAREKIDKIEGLAECMTYWKKAKASTLSAKKIYEDLDWLIWRYLHGLGYFAGKKGYGPNMSDIDFSKADIIG